MLRIEIPADDYAGLTFSKLERFNLPRPVNGFDSEINDNIILSFDDEQQAIDYTHLMDGYAESLSDHSSPEYMAATEIIQAISNDAFVRNYIQG